MKNPRKTQGLHEKTPEPKVGSKNPRSWEKTQGVATLSPAHIAHNLFL